MTAISAVLKSAGIPDAEVESTRLGVACRLAPDRVLEALRALRESEHDYRVLVDLLGTDTEVAIEITYHLRSLSRDEEVYVKTTLDYGEALASVWTVFPSALMPERETAELFGLTLTGHPNPKRLLTTDGVEPLLRKSVPLRTVEEVRHR